MTSPSNAQCSYQCQASTSTELWSLAYTMSREVQISVISAAHTQFTADCCGKECHWEWCFGSGLEPAWQWTLCTCPNIDVMPAVALKFLLLFLFTLRVFGQIFSLHEWQSHPPIGLRDECTCAILGPSILDDSVIRWSLGGQGLLPSGGLAAHCLFAVEAWWGWRTCRMAEDLRMWWGKRSMGSTERLACMLALRLTPTRLPDHQEAENNFSETLNIS